MSARFFGMMVFVGKNTNTNTHITSKGIEKVKKICYTIIQMINVKGERMRNYDFLLELQLKKLNAELSQRHTCCMSVFEQMLKSFLAVFPTFTDHTLLHSLNVINLSNQLLRDEVEKLNAEEIYILLMGAALHDVGMGVEDKKFDAIIDAAGLREYVNEHPDMSKPTLIRKFHNDFSFHIIKKYWSLFEIPNERYADAIAEVGRGHRKTDLMDERLYPTDFELGEGKRANLALLAAVLRLADELDVASDRNPELLYNTETMEDMSQKDLFEFSKHKAIHTVAFTEDTVVITADTDEAYIADGIVEALQTVNETLIYCISVIDARSDLKIDCRRIRLILNNNEVRL